MIQMQSQPPSFPNIPPLPLQQSKIKIIQMQEQLLPKPPWHPQPHCVADKSLIGYNPRFFSYGIYYARVFKVLIFLMRNFLDFHMAGKYANETGKGNG